jgi:hypothetical protein
MHFEVKAIIRVLAASRMLFSDKSAPVNRKTQLI